MLVKIIKTTDGKHIGETFEVSTIDYDICLAFGMKADRINWFGDICILQNVNYTIKLEKL